MNQDTIKGKLKQVKGELKDQVGKATNNPTTSLSGKKDKAVGKLQEGYGNAKDDAARKVNRAADDYENEKKDRSDK